MESTDDHRPAAKRRRLRLRKPTWRGWFAIGLVVVAAGLFAAWAIDYGSLGDRVARNVTVENVDVGRTTGTGLQQALAHADAEYGKGTVEFVIDGRSYPMSAADIGLHLDTPATRRAARQIARNDPAPLRPLYWLTSWFTPRRVPVTVSLDRAKLSRALAGLPGQTPVTEPKVVGSVDAIGTSPGAAGNGFDPARVAGQIERVARDGALPLRVPLVAETIEPVVSDEEIDLLAAQARSLTDRTIELTIPGKSMTATPAMLRSWVTSVLPDGARHAKLSMDSELAVPTIRQQLGTKVTEPVPATFTVNDSQVLLVPQVDGLTCCSTRSGDTIMQALETDTARADLPLTQVPPDFTTAKARALGITTLLGAGLPAQTQVLWKPDAPKPTAVPDGPPAAPGAPTATSSTSTSTSAPARSGVGTGQFVVAIPNRRGQLTNVDRALPLLRGRIIMPGKQLSLNEVIGPPDPSRRFVPADVATAEGPTWISGGGTDLVAAALFEAAYESGLDIPTSTRHGVLPEGVRPGIEATLGWSQPDLVIANPSDHAVLVWADRVPAGVRVQLFGTPLTSNVSSVTDRQQFGPRNACLAVTVKRTRVFTDGDQAQDSFQARYTPPPTGRDDPNRVICPG